MFNQGNILGSSSITYADLVSNIQLGQENDATSLECLRDAVSFVTLGNQYRAKENLPALKISSAMMAMAELNIDYQDTNEEIFEHTNVFWCLENLASRLLDGTWEYGSFPGVSDNPYEGWYTKEKNNYDTNNGGATGHYETLTDRQGEMLLTGFGVRHRYVNQMITATDNNQYECRMHDKYYSQVFSSKDRMYDIGSGVTPEQFISYLDKYMCIAVGHDLKLTKGTAPTCTEGGSSDYYTCNKCGKYFCDAAGKNEISEGSWKLGPKGHTWNSDYTVDVQPTCTKEGSKSKHCSVCNTIDESSITEIPKADHTYGDWITTKEAKCTEAGLKKKVCSVCNDTVTEVINAKGHDWSKTYTVDKQADCRTEGSESIHCEVCDAIDETKVRVVPKTEHKYGNWQTETAVTCTKDGLNVRTCSICGDRQEETIKTGGHQWNDYYTVDVEAGHDQEGSESIHCSVCGESDPATVRTIPAQEHNFTEWKVTKEPTCEETGMKTRSCPDCMIVQRQEIPNLGHDWDPEFRVDVEPTCTEAGRESRYCRRCGEKLDVAVTGTRPIPAKGHSFGPWQITVEPTADKEGTRVHECTVCGAVEEGSIDKLTPQQAAQKALEKAKVASANAKSAAQVAAQAKEKADEAAKTPGAAAIEAAEEAEKTARAAAEAAAEAEVAAVDAFKAAESAYGPDDDEYKEAVTLAQNAKSDKENADAALTEASQAVKDAQTAKATADAEKAAADKAAAEKAQRARDGIYDAKIPKVKASKPAAKKNNITVKWKKLSKKQLKKSKATHYEIWVSTSSKFPAGALTKEKIVKKSKSSVKIKGLKKNTKYYVRVRAIRKSGNVKYVGKWRQKTIRTKKK